MCVYITILLLASTTFRGCVVVCLLTADVPSITKFYIAPKSAMSSFVLNQNAAPANSCLCRILSRAQNIYNVVWPVDTFEAIMVTLSPVTTCTNEQISMKYNKCVELT
jgi:hypothetical protein